MYIYIYVYTYIFTYIHICMYMYIYMSIHISSNIYIYTLYFGDDCRSLTGIVHQSEPPKSRQLCWFIYKPLNYRYIPTKNYIYNYIFITLYYFS